MIRLVDPSDAGNELGAAFFTDGHSFTVQNEEIEDDVGSLSGEMSDDDGLDDTGKPGQPLREQDRFLPIANVAKIMKKAVPDLGKIAKEARECVQECVSEFISFITSEASERCHTEKRKTINGEDILFAMATLGFENYVEPLKLYLQKYRETMKGEKLSAAEEVFVGDDLITSRNTGTVLFTYQDHP